MKVLVTGACGYIGSILCRKLLDLDGEQVTKLTAVDNLYRKQNTISDLSMDGRFEFIRADIVEQGDMVNDLCREHDVILWLAGYTGMNICNRIPGQAWAVNYASVVDLVRDMRTLNKKIIIPTSISGFGKSEDNKPLDETAVLNPVSVYGRSKVKAEEVVCQEGGVSLRLSTCFGPSPCMRLDLLVNNFTWDAWTKRHITLFQKGARRCYLHVSDAADAFIFAIENYEKMQGNPYNVGLNSDNLTKEDLARKVAEHTECHIVEAEFASDPDVRDYYIDSGRIMKLGFTPRFSVDDGIQQLLKFYRGLSVDSANVFADNWVV